MLESGVGFSVAATRQKGGSPETGSPFGGVNVPLEIDCAAVMVVFASFACASDAQRESAVDPVDLVDPRAISGAETKRQARIFIIIFLSTSLVTPGRFELPTCGLGNRRSIHLSYGATLAGKYG